MEVLPIVLLLAFLIESLVEVVFSTLKKTFPFLARVSGLEFYAAMVAGIIGALVYRFDFLVILATWLNIPLSSSLFGTLISGLAIGRGSNYLHDLVAKFLTQRV